jgi:phage tail sheath protein FI
MASISVRDPGESLLKGIFDMVYSIERKLGRDAETAGKLAREAVQSAQKTWRAFAQDESD